MRRSPRAAYMFALCVWLFSSMSAAQGQAPEAPDLEALWSVRELANDFALSPDGEQIAIIERQMDIEANAWRHTLVLIRLADGNRRRMADAGGVILRSSNGRQSGAPIDRVAQFSPDGAWLYFLAAFENGVELWRVSQAGGEARRIADFGGDVTSFAVMTTGEVAVEVAATRDALALDREQVLAFGFLADDNFAPGYARMPLPQSAQARIILTFDDDRSGVVTQRPAPAEPLNSDPVEERVRIGPLDPTSNAHAPPLGVFLRTASGDMACPSRICQGDIEAAWARSSPAGESIVFHSRTGHARAFETVGEWRPGERARLVRQDDDRLSGCRLQEEILICVQDDARTPKRLIAINVELGGERVLYDPNPQWSRFSLPRTERLEFTDDEGNQSFADLVYPRAYSSSQRYPLVIVQYRSRGFLAGGVGGETPIYPLSTRGYAVLSVDRPEFRAREAQMPLADLQREIELTRAERRIKRVALDHFISVLASRNLIDERRIGITGLSDGAETLYAMVIDQPGRFAAAVAGTPPTDPAGWWLNAPSYRAHSYARLGLTAPWETAPSPWTPWWRANSAALHAGIIRTPILLNLGESEALRAFPLITRLRDQHTPVEAFIYPGAYHVKSAPSHILSAQVRTIAWLDYWLRDMAPDLNRPETSGASERWESMRIAALRGQPSPSSR